MKFAKFLRTPILKNIYERLLFILDVWQCPKYAIELKFFWSMDYLVYLFPYAKNVRNT